MSPLPPGAAVFPEFEFGIAQPTGVATARVIVEYSLALAGHDDWRPGFTEVWDVRHAEVDLGPSDIKVMVDLERQTESALSGSTTLIVCSRHLILSAVSFYSHLASAFGRTVVGVPTGGEAAAILGIAALPDLQHPESGR